MTDEERRVHAEQVLERADRESEHLRAVLERSRAVSDRALPVLERAGLLRRR